MAIHATDDLAGRDLPPPSVTTEPPAPRVPRFGTATGHGEPLAVRLDKLTELVDAMLEKLVGRTRSPKNAAEPKSLSRSLDELERRANLLNEAL